MLLGIIIGMFIGAFVGVSIMCLFYYTKDYKKPAQKSRLYIYGCIYYYDLRFLLPRKRTANIPEPT